MKKIVLELPGVEDILSSVANVLNSISEKISEQVTNEAYDEEDEINDEELHSMQFGTPFDENKRFGAGFEIDEPRSQDYEHKWKFLDDHAAYDRFVDAGEECVERGLEKKNNAPIHKVNAIRTKVGDLPPFGVDVIGETNWWDEEPSFDW